MLPDNFSTMHITSTLLNLYGKRHSPPLKKSLLLICLVYSLCTAAPSPQEIRNIYYLRGGNGCTHATMRHSTSFLGYFFSHVITPEKLPKEHVQFSKKLLITCIVVAIVLWSSWSGRGGGGCIRGFPTPQ